MILSGIALFGCKDNNSITIEEVKKLIKEETEVLSPVSKPINVDATINIKEEKVAAPKQAPKK